jgi:hypothetical protein
MACCDPVGGELARITVTLSEVSVDDLLEQIKRHIAAHRATAPDKPQVRNRVNFSEMAYDRIEEAALLSETVFVRPFITPANLPVFGPVWQKVRNAAHQLVIFYVNRHAGAQVVFNREIVNGLRAVVQDLDQDGQLATGLEVAALRAQVRDLQRRLELLEKECSNASSKTE